MSELFAPNFKTESYWWEHAERPDLGDTTLPQSVDVLIIGSGYTGLMAARETAKGGRSTLVIDAEHAGWGCSTRNGGQVSTSIKPSLTELSGRTNEATAFAIRRSGMEALAYIESLIASENLDCGWQKTGRFLAAHNAKQYESLTRTYAHQPKGLEVPVEMVPRAEQQREIQSDLYHGGCLHFHVAALHPVKYFLGLLRLARASGATIVDRCRVTSIDRNGPGFLVSTAKGKVRARDIVIATNGYTGVFAPWHRRRVIPIGSYIIATEPRPEAEMRRLIPNNRMITDTRRVVFYYRLSPDQRSVLFGGRVAYMESNPIVSAPRLHSQMCLVFPGLKDVRISHSWMGFVAYTFDTLPHVGRQDGIYYAMGYCGSGVSLATYFGMRIGQQVLGKPEGKTPLDNVPFQTRPFYTGNPWFLAPSVWWYRLLDQLPI